MSEGIILEESPDAHEQFQVSSSALMVIFGASGDLANRKLLPALYKLALQRLLPPNFIILGYARSSMSDREFRERARASMVTNPEIDFQSAGWEAFAPRLYYMAGGYDDAEGFEQLRDRISSLDEQWDIGGNRLYYLSTPPSVYEPIISLLGAAGLVEHKMGDEWTRVVIEKPFGSDLASAHKLNDHVLSVFDEDQVYRIDHYLGKETVQNVLVFRFANGIFEPVWNRNYVDNVQITVAESIGVEGRGGYYEKSGALRDMVQNHLLQLVALTAMEPPNAFDAKSVRDQKVNLLQAIRPLQPDEVPEYVVRAQYAAGTAATRPVPAYLEEDGVAPDSTTETYVAWRLEIDNWRWQGVPFYLRTGKALPRKATEISVTFRRAPHLLFDTTDGLDGVPLMAPHPGLSRASPEPQCAHDADSAGRRHHAENAGQAARPFGQPDPGQSGIHLRPQFWRPARRLSEAPARCRVGGFDPVYAARRGRDRVAADHAGVGGLANAGVAGGKRVGPVPSAQLPGRHLGTGRVRRPAGARRPALDCRRRLSGRKRLQPVRIWLPATGRRCRCSKCSGLPRSARP